ncbi:PREDICTED: uncharacterized protein LOC105367972 [Ceratosolen solmsi marchali]|uniref:Uncharacterized protein LOC105367972 n=1 Tax=Ceratosolen solmsi marchali TaxID=326594 RepID=A0AAJ7E284_9HYME|nr:PREDICTED: uncharacterized protein LOC105367972 [Ceratosolen solmsi marchali]
MRSSVINLVFLFMLLLPKYRIKASTLSLNKQNVAQNLLEKALLQLVYQRRLFMDGFGNDTAALQRNYDFYNVPALKSPGEGRSKKKKLKQMNRTLLAIVMAYTLKFMFLIPSFVGTLILFKFTAALAGFFYALFAAVLGLEHRYH